MDKHSGEFGYDFKGRPADVSKLQSNGNDPVNHVDRSGGAITDANVFQPWGRMGNALMIATPALAVCAKATITPAAKAQLLVQAATMFFSDVQPAGKGFFTALAGALAIYRIEVGIMISDSRRTLGLMLGPQLSPPLSTDWFSLANWRILGSWRIGD